MTQYRGGGVVVLVVLVVVVVTGRRTHRRSVSSQFGAAVVVVGGSTHPSSPQVHASSHCSGVSNGPLHGGLAGVPPSGTDSHPNTPSLNFTQ
jgi:hypothetical protein